MFKLFSKKELVQEVVRVEDLRVGDLMQYDPYVRARVQSVTPLTSDELRVRVEKIPLVGTSGEVETMTLYGCLKLFVWK